MKVFVVFGLSPVILVPLCFFKLFSDFIDEMLINVIVFEVNLEDTSSLAGECGIESDQSFYKLIESELWLIILAKLVSESDTVHSPVKCFDINRFKVI